MTKDRYLEIRDKNAPVRIGEQEEADQYELDNPDDPDVKRIVEARKMKNEADKARENLKDQVDNSKYLSDEKKDELNGEIENAPLYDLEKTLPGKIKKAEDEAKAELLKALEPKKEELRKLNYESKLSEDQKNEIGRGIAAAETMEELEKVEEKLNAYIKGEKPAEPAEPADNDDKKEAEVKPEDDKKATVEENDDKKAEVKEEKTEPKKEVKANTPATGSEVVLAAITFGVSVLGTVVTAAKRK